jgi:hypothetical protein
VKKRPVSRATASATSKRAAAHASRSGKGKPTEPMYWAVSSIPANFMLAPSRKTPAKMSRATRIAAVLVIGVVLSELCFDI